MKELYFKTRAQWRKWLQENHRREKLGVWLVYYKKETGKPTLSYGETVEEALCFGWVDSIIKKLDEERFARKFTPRKPDSMWSASNKKRVDKLMRADLMRKPGLALVEHARAIGSWDDQFVTPEDLLNDMHPDFSAALATNARAKANLDGLAPSSRKQYLAWINIAKREETRAKRIKQAVQLLSRGEKLGLK